MTKNSLLISLLFSSVAVFKFVAGNYYANVTDDLSPFEDPDWVEADLEEFQE